MPTAASNMARRIPCMTIASILTRVVAVLSGIVSIG